MSENTDKNLPPVPSEESLKSRKKREKWRRIKENRVAKRKLKKAKRATTTTTETRQPTTEEGPKDSKKFRKQQERQRLEAVLKHVEGPSDDTPPPLHVAIDLQFEDLMSEKELSHLAGQLRRVYGANKSSASPALVSICHLRPGSKTAQVLRQKNDGFDNYIWHTTPLAGLYFRNPRVIL